MPKVSVRASSQAVKRRGPCLNRSVGQTGGVYRKQGSVWDPNAFAYGKYYEDTKSGVRRHRTIPLGRCRTKTVAKHKLRAYLAEQKINDAETFHRIMAPGLTFRLQAQVWLESLRTRRRRSLKPATIANYTHYLNKRLLPLLGDLPLSDVGNSALEDLSFRQDWAGRAGFGFSLSQPDNALPELLQHAIPRLLNFQRMSELDGAP